MPMCFALVLTFVSPSPEPRDDPSGYAYVFRDDELSGGAHDANDVTIRAARHAARDQLLRPRLNFVPELLKSVESL